MGKEGLTQRKSKIQLQRQKITVAWEDTSEKWDSPDGLAHGQMAFQEASLTISSAASISGSPWTITIATRSGHSQPQDCAPFASPHILL